MAEAEEISLAARKLSLPVLADPLSGLRPSTTRSSSTTIDNLAPAPTAPARGGHPLRPLSYLEGAQPPCSSARVPSRWRSMSPDARFQRGDGRRSWVRHPSRVRAQRMAPRPQAQRRFADAWVALNDEARLRILAVEWDGSGHHDSLRPRKAPLRALASSAGAGRLVPFSANSMIIRAVDTFYVKDGKPPGCDGQS